MAKAIITIEDNEDGAKVSVEFDPPVTDDMPGTTAVYLAMKALEGMRAVQDAELVDAE